MDRVPLTPNEKRWLINCYCRGVFSRGEIKHFWGWTIPELRDVKPVSEEHYLIKCPKCKSSSVAMSRHYTNMGVIGVSVICRDCNTRSFAKTYVDAMVAWNKEDVKFSH